MPTTGRSRLAAELTGVSGPGGEQRSWFEPAQVASVVAGGAGDGNALATLNFRGQLVPAAYLQAYTPTAGQTVLVLVQPPQLIIVGRVIGTP